MNLIYLHRNKINNKCYVGRSCHIKNPNNRWQNGKGYKRQPFYDDIVKYGWDNFEHIILENDIPDEDVDKREKYWIAYYHSDNPEFGYNARTSGGSVSAETRIRMSQAYYRRSPEVKEKMKQALLNYSRTADRTGKDNGMYGGHRTGESAARKRSV